MAGGNEKKSSAFDPGGGTFRPQPQQFDPYDPAVFKTEGALDSDQLQGIIEALKRIGVFQISQPPDTLNY